MESRARSKAVCVTRSCLCGTYTDHVYAVTAPLAPLSLPSPLLAIDDAPFTPFPNPGFLSVPFGMSESRLSRASVTLHNNPILCSHRRLQAPGRDHQPVAHPRRRQEPQLCSPHRRRRRLRQEQGRVRRLPLSLPQRLCCQRLTAAWRDPGNSDLEAQVQNCLDRLVSFESARGALLNEGRTHRVSHRIARRVR